MSQEKVDKRKYEKKHRKEIERKRKIRTTVKCVTAALIIGAIVGVPLGIRIYKEQPKFVGDSTLGAFINNYIDENYASDVAVLNETTENTETESDDPIDAVNDAIEKVTGQKAEEVNAENVDETLNTDSETEESSESDK